MHEDTVRTPSEQFEDTERQNQLPHIHHNEELKIVADDDPYPEEIKEPSKKIQ